MKSGEKCPGCNNQMKLGASICSSCRTAAALSRRIEKQKKIDALKNRTCKVCGKLIGSADPRRVVCSKQCGYKDKEVPRVTVSCCVCNKKVLRSKKELSHRSKFCCSLDCQHAFALVMNRGRPRVNPFSINLPVLLRCECGTLTINLQCTHCARISSCVRHQVQKVRKKRSDFEQKRSDPWVLAIRSRLTGARYREAKRKSGLVRLTNIERQIDRIANKRLFFCLDPWTKAIANKLSNLTKRRRRKDASKACYCSRSQAEIGRKPVQMCFDWMGD